MNRLTDVVLASCSNCAGEPEPTVGGLCRTCCEDAPPLPLWMVRVLFAIDAARAPNAWREYLDYARSLRGSEDRVTCWTLAGSLDEHRWARLVLEAVAS